jgi:hypothetical protein
MESPVSNGYRTIEAPLTCDYSHELFWDEVQFKTGEMDAFQRYQLNQPITDLPLNASYEAWGQRYSSSSLKKRKYDEIECFFQALVTLVDAQELQILKRGLIFRRPFEVAELLAEKEKKQIQFYYEKRSQTQLFNFFDGYPLLWKGQLAKPGSEIYASLISLLNQNIKALMHPLGWPDLPLIRVDLKVLTTKQGWVITPVAQEDSSSENACAL